LQMLQWTVAGEGARFAGIVHHADGIREYAYDRQSKIGKPDKALDEAAAKGWSVVDMKRDWKTVFGQKSEERRNEEAADLRRGTHCCNLPDILRADADA
jgi:hypothetical protein